MKTRTHFYLTPEQSKTFKALSKKKRYSVAELIRRALDEWLEKRETKKVENRASFLAELKLPRKDKDNNDDQEQ